MYHKQRKENLVQSIHLKRERTDPYSTTTKTLSNISDVESIQFEKIHIVLANLEQILQIFWKLLKYYTGTGNKFYLLAFSSL